MYAVGLFMDKEKWLSETMKSGFCPMCPHFKASSNWPLKKHLENRHIQHAVAVQGKHFMALNAYFFIVLLQHLDSAVKKIWFFARM